MNRRVRTSALTLNAYGHYVAYVALHRGGHPVYLSLTIFDGPSAGVWKFDL